MEFTADFDQNALAGIIDTMQVAVTLLDPKGTILFYNDHAPTILDRKPEYIGTDIRNYHQPQSNEKVDKILNAYARGETKPFFWKLDRNGRTFNVKVAPLIKNGRFTALVHTVMLDGA